MDQVHNFVDSCAKFPESNEHGPTELKTDDAAEK